MRGCILLDPPERIVRLAQLHVAPPPSQATSCPCPDNRCGPPCSIAHQVPQLQTGQVAHHEKGQPATWRLCTTTGRRQICWAAAATVIWAAVEPTRTARQCAGLTISLLTQEIMYEEQVLSLTAGNKGRKLSRAGGAAQDDKRRRGRCACTSHQQLN